MEVNWNFIDDAHLGELLRDSDGLCSASHAFSTASRGDQAARSNVEGLHFDSLNAINLANRLKSADSHAPELSLPRNALLALISLSDGRDRSSCLFDGPLFCSYKFNFDPIWM